MNHSAVPYGNKELVLHLPGQTEMTNEDL